MKRNLLILVIILLIGFIVNSCGDDEEKPTPTQQTYTIDLGNGKIVYVNYTALPGTTPTYMSDLETAIEIIGLGMPTATYKINIIDGNSGFAKTGSKTLSVGKSWFSGKGLQQIMEEIAPLMSDWAAIIQPTHDNGWKQQKGYFVKIENVNANLLNVV